MPKSLLRSPYVIAGILIFIILLVVGILAKFTVVETLLGALTITVIGVGKTDQLITEFRLMTKTDDMSANLLDQLNSLFGS